jgi:hypothetical protein
MISFWLYLLFSSLLVVMVARSFIFLFSFSLFVKNEQEREKEKSEEGDLIDAIEVMIKDQYCTKQI